MSDSLTSRTAARKASLSITISLSLLKLLPIESVMPFSHLILCHHLLHLPSIFPSTMVFSNESALLIRWTNTGASASSSVLLMNIQGWFPLGLTGLISFLSKTLSRVFSSTTVWKHQFFGDEPSLWSHSHIHTWQKSWLLLYEPFSNQIGLQYLFIQYYFSYTLWAKIDLELKSICVR